MSDTTLPTEAQMSQDVASVPQADLPLAEANPEEDPHKEKAAPQGKHFAKAKDHDDDAPVAESPVEPDSEPQADSLDVTDIDIPEDSSANPDSEPVADPPAGPKPERLQAEDAASSATPEEADVPDAVATANGDPMEEGFVETPDEPEAIQTDDTDDAIRDTLSLDSVIEADNASPVDDLDFDVPLDSDGDDYLGEAAASTESGDRSTQVTNAPGRNQMPVENRPGSNTSTGSTDHLAWGARSDVGLVRGHNEDAFLVQAPVFAVCDGMGGHAAGEVASHIAVKTIGEQAPDHADEILLGAAVEAANEAVLEGSLSGIGKPGMGCTATSVLIENNLMAVAHVGDSRVYLLHNGTLVRITRDHSYVEELVDAGEITADEARVHPSRSIITRALGSDPDMYADHFTLDVSTGDRIILCSDGLSSMVPDKDIEELAVSNVTPQAAADTLVSAALTAGGHDNVTVVVVDVVEDGLAEVHRAERHRSVLVWAGIAVLALILAGVVMIGLAKNSWYVGNNDGTVGVFRGINDEFFGIPLYELVETSTVEVRDLPDAIQHQLEDGIGVANVIEGCDTVERYRDQIEDEKTKRAATQDLAKNASGSGKQGSVGEAVESGDATPPAAAATGQQAAQDATQAAVQEAASGSAGKEGE